MASQTNTTNQADKMNYFKSVRAELKKVSWPTREELINYTIVVLVTCTLASIFFYAVDSVFHFGLTFLM